MPEHIEELNKKYIVLKRDDVDKYLSDGIKEILDKTMSFIAQGRENDGKQRSNEYVVLNMADPFSLSIFYKETSKVVVSKPGKIKDYAVAIVNTILYSKK